MKSRWYNGAVYRIGELAERANVSKRTIDYYTNLGLLIAERSSSNYRIYPEEALEDLKRIEEYKQMHLPLQEIKCKLRLNKLENVREQDVEQQIEALTKQMKQLHKDLNILLPIIQNHQQEDLSKRLNKEGNALLASLLIITN